MTYICLIIAYADQTLAYTLTASAILTGEIKGNGPKYTLKTLTLFQRIYEWVPP